MLKNAWQDIVANIVEILKISANGSVENKLLTMSKIIISYVKAQYGYLVVRKRSSGK